MKKITLLLVFLTAYTINAQNSKTIEKVVISDLTFTVDHINELEDINWSDIKAVFSENSKEEEVSLGFKVKKPKGKNQKKLLYGFKVKGKTSDIEGLIRAAKKGIIALNRIKSRK